MSLVDDLIKEGWLKTDKVIDAFRSIDRADFMPEEIRNLAEVNEAFSIGFDQTISQPLVVAFMIEKLQVSEGDIVLDIGSGSGWTTALLSYLVGDKGKVVALEVIPELREFGEKNVSKYNFIKKGTAQFALADGTKGYKSEAPFDKILASAAVQDKIPLAWKKQLKEGGIIVTPVRHSIWVLEKKGGKLKKEEHEGFTFVPLIEK